MNWEHCQCAAIPTHYPTLVGCCAVSKSVDTVLSGKLLPQENVTVSEQQREYRGDRPESEMGAPSLCPALCEVVLPVSHCFCTFWNY